MFAMIWGFLLQTSRKLFLDSKGNKFQFHSQFYNFCCANYKKAEESFELAV